MKTEVQELFDRNRRFLAQVCRQYGVEQLELFGSATTPDFQAERSDLDFIVEFSPDAKRLLVDRFLGLAEALERVFGCSIDLLTESMIRNPYFRQAVNDTRKLVYERQDEEAATGRVERR